MSVRRALVALLALLAPVVALFASARALLNRRHLVARSVIRDPEEHTFFDDSGAVHSIQAADVLLPEGELDRLWSPMNLERLARTYWRFLSRVTFGLVRVYYTERERFVCLLIRQLPLLTFQAPEYELDGDRGIVRWMIKSGVLVARSGRGRGYLEIDVRRSAGQRPGEGRAHVEVEVANFYPAIASGISRWMYSNTQSRIHVIVTHGFLRSLARLDLEESRVGRFADRDAPLEPPGGERRPAAAA